MKIISVFYGRECLDQAVFASNVAVSLAKQTKLSVALVDFSFSGTKNLRLLFDYDSNKSVLDITENAHKLDENIIKGYVTAHSSGVTVINGIESGDKKLLDINKVKNAISVLSKSYSFLLVLLPQLENQLSEVLIACSGLALLPVSPNLLSVSFAKKQLDMLNRWHFPDNVTKTVLFCPDTGHNLKNDDVEKIAGTKIFAEIKYENEVLVTSINESKPAVLSVANSSFSEGINKLAKMLLQDDLYARATDEKDLMSDVDDKDPRLQISKLKERIHKELISRMDSSDVDLKTLADKTKAVEVREKTRNIMQQLIAREEGLSREERVIVIEELLNEVLGLGCLEQFLADTEITEIMVNGKDDIFVEKKGKLHYTGSNFMSDTQLRTVIDRIVTPLGRRVDESSPLVDARLQDGSRVNIIIPPLSLVGPVITIRKFSKKKLTIEDLIGFGALSADMGRFLDTCVKLRKNIIISGGTGSGKTTLLNVTSGFIPQDERICTIEDSAELKLPQKHVVSLESRPASLEGTGEIPIRRLVINALRMRPDRIVVGECRGGETLDMLQAMNTGHDGSLTTLHSNSPKDAISRIATMTLMSGTDLPEKAIREQIASAVQIIVQLNRMSDGTRKVTEIAEVTGLQGGEVNLLPIFKFEQESIKDGKVVGRFAATGNIPTFFDKIQTHGLTLEKNIFKR